jgi:lactate permease
MLPLVLASLAMGATQMAVAWAGGYSLAAFTAAGAGLVVVALCARLPRYSGQTSVPTRREDLTDVPESGANGPVSIRTFCLAFSAYFLLIGIVLVVNLVPAIEDVLSFVRLDLAFPQTSTQFGWINPAADSYRTIKPLGDTGALLLYAAMAGLIIYRAAGLTNPGTLGRAATRTMNSALASSIGVVTMVGMAILMTESGMTYLLARGIGETTGPLYALFSPFVGVLGAFMTGSNTSSNILFGALQRDTALLLGFAPSMLLAAQTTGGAIGSMLAPAKVILGCSTVGLGGREGPAIRRGTAYGVAIGFAIGAVTLGASIQT